MRAPQGLAPDTGPGRPDLYTVLGGTGFLGRRVVARLLEDGHSVRIAARHPDRQGDLALDPRVEFLEADLFEPDTNLELSREISPDTSGESGPADKGGGPAPAVSAATGCR